MIAKEILLNLRFAFLLIVVLLSLNGCAVVHHYDEITGKVVELETGKPIEGAAVHASYFTKAYNFVVDPTSWYLNSQETKTDANGEFVIPSQLAFAFRPINLFDESVTVMIFKPGYGCYGNPGEKRGRTMEGNLNTKMGAIIGLPLLNTRKERIYHNRCSPSTSVPKKDRRFLLELQNQERIRLGFEPIPLI